LTAALCSCVVGLSACGDDPEPAPREFFGIVAEEVLALPEERPRGLDAIAAMRVGVIRETFDWATIETRPGRFDLRPVDVQVLAAARRGLTLLPVIQTTPEFRATTHRRIGGPMQVPRRPKEIAPLVRAVVRRYGPDGTLWRGRESIARPIRAWQIWNEPNLPAFWAGHPDPAEYTRLLTVASRAVKEVDPEATVISAGLPESDAGLPRRTYLSSMIAAGALPALDAVGVHAYAPGVDESVKGIEEVRAILDRAGSPAGIWVTEWGWATQGPDSPFTVGLEGQADRIRAFIERMAEERDELKLRGLVYFNWRDSTPPEGIRDFFGLHTGLLMLDRERKPGFEAFVDAVGKYTAD
jgi:hypothetical protein